MEDVRHVALYRRADNAPEAWAPACKLKRVTSFDFVQNLT